MNLRPDMKRVGWYLGVTLAAIAILAVAAPNMLADVLLTYLGGVVIGAIILGVVAVSHFFRRL
jgi:hypothetical protein